MVTLDTRTDTLRKATRSLNPAGNTNQLGEYKTAKNTVQRGANMIDLEFT